MRLIKLSYTVLLSLFLFSCGDKDKAPKIGELDFGEVNPEKSITKTMTIDFNPAAQSDPNAFLEFQFVSTDGKPLNDVSFKIQGKPTSENKFKIKHADLDPNHKVKIEIIFSQKAKEKDYNGYLMLINSSDELKQNITYGDASVVKNLHEQVGVFHAKYVVPTPQWKLYLMYALAFLFVSLVLWLLIIRNKVYPPMTGTINTPEGAIKLNGYRMFYIYSGEIPKAAKQGFFSSLFTGKIGKKSIMSLQEDGKSCHILVTTQSTPKGIRNRISLSDNTISITKGQNVLYDQCDYVISKSDSKLKFEFVYSNIKHQQTI